MKYQSRPHYLHSPAFTTQSITDVEEAFLAKWLPRHDLPDKAELFHYTTLAGMQGILANRSLWLGHVSCLNDPSEIDYGQQIIDDVIRELTLAQGREECRKFLEDLSGFVRSFARHTIHHTFVTSFCESGNLLSQWRGYAHKGQGYCLGFDRRESGFSSRGSSAKVFRRSLSHKTWKWKE